MKTLAEAYWNASAVIGAAFLAAAILGSLITFGAWLFAVVSEASWNAYYSRQMRRRAALAQPTQKTET